MNLTDFEQLARRARLQPSPEVDVSARVVSTILERRRRVGSATPLVGRQERVEWLLLASAAAIAWWSVALSDPSSQGLQELAYHWLQPWWMLLP